MSKIRYAWRAVEGNNALSPLVTALIYFGSFLVIGLIAIETIRDAEASLGVSIGLVIIDTFAKLIAGGSGDENSARDQGLVFANVQRVKNATDTHVALIGHTGKDEARGMRAKWTCSVGGPRRIQRRTKRPSLALKPYFRI